MHTSDWKTDRRTFGLVLQCGEGKQHNRVWLIKGEIYIDLTLEVCRMVGQKHTVRWDVQGNDGVTVGCLPEHDPGIVVSLPDGEEVHIRMLEMRGEYGARFSFRAPPGVSIWRHAIVERDNLVPAHILNS